MKLELLFAAFLLSFISCYNLKKKKKKSIKDHAYHLESETSKNQSVNLDKNWIDNCEEKIRIECIESKVGDAFIHEFKTDMMPSLNERKAIFQKNVSINTSVSISVKTLLNMLENAGSSYDLLKIVLCQPNISNTSNYPQIAKHSQEDLYFLYTLLDTNNHQHLNNYYDIAILEHDTSDHTPVLIDPIDFEAFISNYYTSKIRYKTTMDSILNSNKTRENTTSIRVDIKQLECILSYWKGKAADVNMNLFGIRLCFAKIDFESAKKNNMKEPQISKCKELDGRFTIVWKPIDEKGNYIPGLCYADMNDLCPPKCND